MGDDVTIDFSRNIDGPLNNYQRLEVKAKRPKTSNMLDEAEIAAVAGGGRLIHISLQGKSGVPRGHARDEASRGHNAV